ncbi:MAG: hypothetical protein CW716_11310 [Candidatus Bathyarchaeum sp.]|nr:MAG: hypothetical protein CW716_11310 [Candidatus Bathyarchaeum sp.]
MLEPNRKIMLSVFLAIISAFSLMGVSYFIFPDASSEPQNLSVHVPDQSLFSELFWVIQWLCFAAFLAIIVVGMIFFTTKMRNKKTAKLA